MKFITFASVAFLIPLLTFAQMKFRSVGTSKPIEFTFGFQYRKGAFVWYKGQKSPIALKLKTLDIDSSERESGQPDFHTYKYSEIYNGKVTGEYGITEWPRNVDNIYYIRFKDAKKFTFKLIEDDFYDGKSMVLLKDVQIHFNSYYNDNLTLVYPNGSSSKHRLNHLDKKHARQVAIKDYNFDGTDDVAFTTTNSSEYNRLYDVFIYNPVNKTFNRLKEPIDKGCGCFEDLKVDQINKKLLTRCKIGTRWKSFVYEFNRSGKLILVKEE